MKATEFTFGGAAAIVTSVALVVGLDAATATRATVVGGLLIVALADNLTDSLSIHFYQEAEHLEQGRAFRATLINFATRLLIALTFVAIVVALPPLAAIVCVVIWGLGLLVALTAIVARERGVPLAPEVSKHLAAAIATVVFSRVIGLLIHRGIG